MAEVDIQNTIRAYPGHEKEFSHAFDRASKLIADYGALNNDGAAGVCFDTGKYSVTIRREKTGEVQITDVDDSVCRFMLPCTANFVPGRQMHLLTDLLDKAESLAKSSNLESVKSLSREMMGPENTESVERSYSLSNMVSPKNFDPAFKG